MGSIHWVHALLLIPHHHLLLRLGYNCELFSFTKRLTKCCELLIVFIVIPFGLRIKVSATSRILYEFNSDEVLMKNKNSVTSVTRCWAV